MNTSNPNSQALFNSLGALIGTTSIFIIFLVYFAIIIGICLVFYLVQAIPMYHLTKKTGYDKPWLAFVPFCSLYPLFILPAKRYTVFNWFSFSKRSNAFWIHFVGTYAGSFILGILSFIIAYIPLINLLSPLLTLAYSAALAILVLIAKWDFYRTFGMDKSASLALAIVSAFVPIAHIVVLYVLWNKEPIYGSNNYYVAAFNPNGDSEYYGEDPYDPEANVKNASNYDYSYDTMSNYQTSADYGNPNFNPNSAYNNAQGYNNDAYNNQNYGAQSYDNNAYNNQNYNAQGYDNNAYNNQYNNPNNMNQ